MFQNLDLNLISLGRVFFINFLFLSIRYIIFAGAAFLIVWVWKKEYFYAFRIQKNFPEKQKIINEIKYSFLTFCIFGIVGIGVFVASKMGYTKIYSEISQYGYAYFFLSIAIAILIHDVYFYFAHRLMHHKWLFKKVHSVHHQSTNPSPWASFSFHPLEAVLEAAIVPILVVIMPIHPLAIVSFMFFMTFMNVLGHLGVELYPNWFLKSQWTNWNNTSLHHNMHHQKFNCNYGLYFNWWDRLFGTNHPTYFQEFHRITSERDIILKKSKELNHETFAIQK